MQARVWKPPGSPGLWGDFLDYLGRAVGGERVHPVTHEYLVHPRRVLSMSLPVRLDDGRVHTFSGYRVVHNIARGPSIGGVRYDPALTVGDVAGLAAWNTLKAAVLNLPFGGAAGGVELSPAELSTPELERVSRRYMAELINLAGPEVDILAPDFGTDERVMAWFMDTYSQGKGFIEPAVVVGKPDRLGGTRGRNDAVAVGLVHVTERFAAREGLALKGAEVAIQGFGQVGRAVARVLHRLGAKVVAVSMDVGGLFDGQGIDVPALEAHYDREGSFEGFPAEPISNAELLALSVDYLVLAAYQHVVHEENADAVHARVVVEGANVPITAAADQILADRGVLVVPHVLAAGGNLVVGYYEWVQDLNQYFWDERRVKAQLKAALVRAFDQVQARAEREGLRLRCAAHRLAIERVDEATRLRGVYP